MKNSLYFLFLIFFANSSTAVVSNDSKSKLETTEQKLKNFIAKDFENRGRIEVERLYSQEAIPPQAEVLAVEPRPALGVVSFEFAWDANGNSKHVFGTATVKLYRPVAVAKTIIRNNEAFNKDNFSFQEREVSPYRVTGYYDDSESLNRLRARGYISPGMVISHSHTQMPFLVNSGEAVMLVRETPSVRVSVRAKALENGREQQWIRVENLSNRKVIQAKVLGPGEVSLH